MTVFHNKSIRWRNLDGTVCTAKVTGCDTADEARTECESFAREFGWTPPHWWQFWRWGEAMTSEFVLRFIAGALSVGLPIIAVGFGLALLARRPLQ